MLKIRETYRRKSAGGDPADTELFPDIRLQRSISKVGRQRTEKEGERKETDESGREKWILIRRQIHHSKDKFIQLMNHCIFLRFTTR